MPSGLSQRGLAFMERTDGIRRDKIRGKQCITTGSWGQAQFDSRSRSHSLDVFTVHIPSSTYPHNPYAAYFSCLFAVISRVRLLLTTFRRRDHRPSLNSESRSVSVQHRLQKTMEYKPQEPTSPAIQPRIIIHGGAGNITPASVTPELYREFRDALLTIVSTHLLGGQSGLSHCDRAMLLLQYHTHGLDKVPT